MSTNYHTVVANGAAATAGNINAPLGQLDAGITQAVADAATAQTAADTAQTAADAAQLTADGAVTDAATAQARADDAYDLASGALVASLLGAVASASAFTLTPTNNTTYYQIGSYTITAVPTTRWVRFMVTGYFARTGSAWKIAFERNGSVYYLPTFTPPTSYAPFLLEGTLEVSTGASETYKLVWANITPGGGDTMLANKVTFQVWGVEESV